ncbi:hypothetical protein ACFL0U_01335 [Pseudomonadota bacterium]
MKNLNIFAIVFSFFLAGCVISHSPSANVVNLDDIDFSSIETMKRGKDCTYNVLFIPLGSPTLFDATKDARIRKVRYIEKSFSGFPLVFLPILSKDCVVVYGE